MTATKLTLPVFPLPVFLLPQGITRLRIFEHKYLRMVKIASQENGFAIVFKQAADSPLPNQWASWVDIINFDQDQDGILIIDIKCKALVKMAILNLQQDTLNFSEVRDLCHWPDQQYDQTIQQLSDSLKKVFQETPLLDELYQGEFIDTPNWVVSRWIELLPINGQDKNKFVNNDSFPQAKSLIKNIISENHDIH